MKQTIEIEVPEGFEAKYCPETNKIELVKKNNKPKSWEEYCKNNSRKNKFYTREEVIAFRALMQLRLLRKAWVGDWVPNYTYNNYNNCNDTNWHIRFKKDEIAIDGSGIMQGTLSFPYKEMAEEFLNYFKNLIIEAKPLL